jgi:hypothetical protein
MLNLFFLLYLLAWKLKVEKIKNLFDSVIVVAFQITFIAEMHANDVFSFLKNHF